jgi:hypothetical protein
MDETAKRLGEPKNLDQVLVPRPVSPSPPQGVRVSLPRLSIHHSLTKEIVRNKVVFDQTDLNPKHEIPAFAEAASRRQANFETISNVQNPKSQNFFVWVI